MIKIERKSVFLGILLGLVFLLLTLSVLTQANPGTRLPSRDYGFYLYIGKQITQGNLPYRDAWESKPPAIFYLNAVALWIGRGSRWGVWFVEFVGLFISLCFSFYVIKKMWGIWPAFGGVVLWSIGLDLTLQGGNLTEEYPLLLHFLSLVLFLKLTEQPIHRLFNFFLGLAFGISFLFRPNNAVVEAAVILTLLILKLSRRGFKSLLEQILWMAAGVVPPILVTGIYFWAHGLLKDMLDAAIFYNLSYSNTAITSTSPLQIGFDIFGIIAWVALAGYIVAVISILKRDAFMPIYVLVLVGWPMVILFSDPARRNYPHYFINWLPFLALLGGLAFHLLVSRWPAVWKNSTATAGGLTFVAAIMFFLLSGRAAEYGKALERVAHRQSSGIEIRSRVAAYVENHTDPGDLVLFWAASPGENFMSNRATPSAYLFYPLYVYSDISARMNEQFLKDVQAKRPVLIVDIGDHEALSLDEETRRRQIAEGWAWEYPPTTLDAFFEFVERNYYLEAKIGDKVVYRLTQP